METWTERTELLFGNEKYNKLQDSTVVVVGLGGVGGYAAEMVARAGVGNMIIIDADTVHISNINRQLPALHSTIGQSKSALFHQRLLDINPELNIIAINEFLDIDFLNDKLKPILQTRSRVFFIDAIDTIQPKLDLIIFCIRNKYKIISSMGAGGKLDPSLVVIADIAKTRSCRLAAVIRRRLKEKGFHKGVKVVFSPEFVPSERIKKVSGERNKKTTVGTLSYLPPIFGCNLASWVIRKITGDIK